VSRVKQAASRLPAGEWVEGYGWDEGLWASRMPEGHILLTMVGGKVVNEKN
jgi:predicted amidohydrolase YtcJ